MPAVALLLPRLLSHTSMTSGFAGSGHDLGTGVLERLQFVGTGIGFTSLREARPRAPAIPTPARLVMAVDFRPRPIGRNGVSRALRQKKKYGAIGSRSSSNRTPRSRTPVLGSEGLPGIAMVSVGAREEASASPVCSNPRRSCGHVMEAVPSKDRQCGHFASIGQITCVRHLLASGSIPGSVQ